MIHSSPDGAVDVIEEGKAPRNRYEYSTSPLLLGGSIPSCSAAASRSFRTKSTLRSPGWNREMKTCSITRSYRFRSFVLFVLGFCVAFLGIQSVQIIVRRHWSISTVA